MKFIFMGSPPIAASILSTLMEANRIPSAVVTQIAKVAGRGHKVRPTAVETLAREKQIPVFPTANVNEEEILGALTQFEPDVLFVVAFGQILRDPILKLPKVCPLNVHASLLPKYRGAAPVQWALLNGDKHTGVTIQKMAKKLDAGDIMVQESFPIEPEDTTLSLWEKVAAVGAQASLKALELIESGEFEFHPQEESQVTLAPKIKKEQAVIDWNEPATKICNQIRALQPWPIAQTKLGETGLKIFQAKPIPSQEVGEPGAIQTDGQTFLNVSCSDGEALSLTEIQLENRKRLDIKDFLKAYRGDFPYRKMGTGS